MKRILTCLILTSVVSCAVLVTYFLSRQPSQLIRYSLDGKGMVCDDTSCLPLAQFDKLDMIVRRDENGVLTGPFYLCCTRNLPNTKYEREELLVFHRSDADIEKDVEVLRKHLKKLPEISMPKSFGTKHTTWHINYRNNVYMNIKPAEAYYYGHPGEAKFGVADCMRQLAMNFIDSDKYRMVRHGTGMLTRSRDCPRNDAASLSNLQKEGKEFLCRAWYVNGEGVFHMYFFIRELGKLRDLAHGHVKGRFNLDEDKIIESKVIWQPDVEHVKLEISVKEGKDGNVIVVISHGTLECEEKFPLRKLVKRFF